LVLAIGLGLALRPAGLGVGGPGLGLGLGCPALGLGLWGPGLGFGLALSRVPMPPRKSWKVLDFFR